MHLSAQSLIILELMILIVAMILWDDKIYNIQVLFKYGYVILHCVTNIWENLVIGILIIRPHQTVNYKIADFLIILNYQTTFNWILTQEN